MLRARRGTIIVKRQDSERATGGGLYLPESVNNKNLFCDVVAIGEGVKAEFTMADTVVVFETKGKFRYEGIEYLTCEPDQILGVVENGTSED